MPEVRKCSKQNEDPHDGFIQREPRPTERVPSGQNGTF